MKKKVLIRITSVESAPVTDMLMESLLLRAVMNDGGEGEIDDGYDNDGAYGDDCGFGAEGLMLPEGMRGGERTTVSAIGEMEEVDGNIILRYSESELTGMAGAETVISFCDPDEVTMVRYGSVNTALCFCASLERRICCYGGPIVNTGVSVITDKFNNTLNIVNGGRLEVVYRVVISGVPVEERTKLLIKVEPIISK